MFKSLIVDPKACTSCRLCELACSERSTAAYRPSRSHIQVAIHADEAFYFPMICLQCDDAPCVEACPTSALTRDPQTNAVLVDADMCTECGECEAACPYGAIRMWDGLAQKCDLCGGDPECVRFCAPGALRYEPEDSWPMAKREAYADRLCNLAQEVRP